jgi:hypothetical protein
LRPLIVCTWSLTRSSMSAEGVGTMGGPSIH